MRLFIILFIATLNYQFNFTFAAGKNHDEEIHEEGNHTDHNDDESSGIEQGESGTKNHKEDGIILSKEAIKNFGIESMEFDLSQSKIELPLAALVTSKDKTQIFFKHEGKFEIVDVTVVSKNDKLFFIEKISIPTSAEVVISGVNFLKIVELSHGEDGSQGHSH